MQGLMAGVLGMREGDIRVIAAYMGGGFGGKFELDGAIFCSAILSKKCYRPVKIVYHEGRRFHRHEAADPDVLLHPDRREEGRDVPLRARRRSSRTAAHTQAWAQRPST